MKVVVTGGSGYIGARLVEQALAVGHDVICASRRRPGVPVSWMQFDLTDTDEIALPPETQIVYHLAADTSANGQDINAEIKSAKVLIDACVGCGAKLIFVSSQTARADAPTLYGRTKWAIEELVLASNGCVIRPGLVYGGEERGLFALIVNAVQMLPVIPAFIPAPVVQPIHVDDLASALLRCAELNLEHASILCFGAETPVSFAVFLRSIARYKLRRFRITLPFPTFFLRAAVAVLPESTARKYGLYRLLSLFELPRMLTDQDLKLVGVTLRPLATGVHQTGDGRRRMLASEGRAMLQYILRCKPPGALIRRYVRMVEKLKAGQALDLDWRYEQWPSLLANLDRNSGDAYIQEVRWRLDAATWLAEASVLGSDRFLQEAAGVRISTSLFRIAKACVLEVLWRGIAFAGLLFQHRPRRVGL